MSPTDPNWLALMFERGVMEYIDAVGIHGFPGVWEYSWEGWPANVAKVRAVLNRYGSLAEVWITEVGFSTWRHEEHRQLGAFVEAMDAPAERMYWYSGRDLDPDRPTVDGFHSDEREYHFGLKHWDRGDKLLFRVWAEGGPDKLRRVAALGERNGGLARSPRALITGGAGFIGSRLAARLASTGKEVLVLDNLSRPGAVDNACFLDELEDRVRIEVGDLRDRCALRAALDGVCEVYHLAAPDGIDPEDEFGTRALGTFNLLEEVRRLDEPPSLVLASTDAVYLPCSEPLGAGGINEDAPIGGHGAYAAVSAEQLVFEYVRRYALPAVVLRLGRVYGPGEPLRAEVLAPWIAAALDGLPIGVGDAGRRVRDYLYVDDAASALLAAQRHAHAFAGQAFNVGGGAAHAASDAEMLELIAAVLGVAPVLSYEPRDQRMPGAAVVDARRFRAATGWTPRVGLREGIQRLHAWLAASPSVSVCRPARSVGMLP
jgi:CDP-paratose 2-epimerase